MQPLVTLHYCRAKNTVNNPPAALRWGRKGSSSVAGNCCIMYKAITYSRPCCTVWSWCAEGHGVTDWRPAAVDQSVKSFIYNTRQERSHIKYVKSLKGGQKMFHQLFVVSALCLLTRTVAPTLASNATSERLWVETDYKLWSVHTQDVKAGSHSTAGLHWLYLQLYNVLCGSGGVWQV